MSMSIYITLEASDVAQKLLDNDELAMDVLACLAEEGDANAGWIATGNSGSKAHMEVPEFLRTLADAIEQNDD
jgi:hypothetical protein